MKRNLHTMGLGALKELLTQTPHDARLTIGNHIAKQNGHGVIRELEHHGEMNIPWCDPEPEERHRGAPRNQREELRKTHKYLGLVPCENCATKWSDTGRPLDGFGRVYENYTTHERWCYVCGRRWRK